MKNTQVSKYFKISLLIIEPNFTMNQEILTCIFSVSCTKHHVIQNVDLHTVWFGKGDLGAIDVYNSNLILRFEVFTYAKKVFK